MKNKNLRRLRCLVTAQTMGNLEWLTRDKMLALRQSVVGPWVAHYVARAKRGD